MNKVKEAMIDYWGNRKCKEYHNDCPACQAWKEYDELVKKLEIIEEIKNIIKKDLIDMEA